MKRQASASGKVKYLWGLVGKESKVADMKRCVRRESWHRGV
jgi:hypothetical protein